jgi:hypothetical protein
VAVLVRPCAVAARRHSEAVFISEQKLSRLLRTRTEKYLVLISLIVLFQALP